MLNNKVIILAIVLLTLFVISPLSAVDNVTGNIAEIQETDNVVESSGNNSEILLDDIQSPESFYELDSLIENTQEGNTLVLYNDYENTGNDYTIYLNKNITIDGQGHTINANKLSDMFYVNAGSVTLKNINFVNANTMNRAGAICFESLSSCSILNSTFVNCSSEYGGALYLNSNSNVVIEDSTFLNCSAKFGGAIYVSSNAAAIISDSVFENNTAEVLGGSLLASGSDTRITRSNFTKSTAKYESGGAIALLNSKIYAQYLQFTECGSEFGGAVALLSSSSNITGTTFKRNNALYSGGAIFAMYGSVYFENNTFTSNCGQKGGGIFLSQTSTDIFNNGFINNSASNGGGIYALTIRGNGIDKNTYADNQGSPEPNCFITLNDNLTITGNDSYEFRYSDVIVSSLPSYYSMLDENLMTYVKDQGSEGNCWAFSAMAALESCILKASGLTFDLSEANMKNLMAMYSDYGLYRSVNDGGDELMVYGYLASWLGPIFEEDDTYYINDFLSPLLKSILHVQDIIAFKRDNFTDNDEIKKAIIKYGAVSTSLYYDSAYMKEGVFSYYYDGNESGNHAACIVGWNDTYSKNNFNSHPAGDGAWIVRNSWGPEWGDSGYFYVSYYDTQFAKVGESESFTFILNDTTHFDRVYQYEILKTTSAIPETGNYVCYKNIFTSQGNEYLSAVSTYFLDECDYNVKIYINGQLEKSKSAKTSMGYYTINLDDFFYLSENDNVTVEFNCSNFNNATPKVPFSKSNLCSNLHISQGVSYVWYNGQWADLSSNNGTACIKMFTTFSPGSKLNPYIVADSVLDTSDDSFIVTVSLPADATGTVRITAGVNDYYIDLAKTDSIKLYGLDENNCTLLVNYSGDARYFTKTISHSVEWNASRTGTYEELKKLIDTLQPGHTLYLTKDFSLNSNNEITISNRITIDGQGHTISANNLSQIFNVLSEGAVIKNIRFIEGDNNRGGAVFLKGSDCIISNCTFENNYASIYGGAIYIYGSDCQVVNCSFENNFAPYAGALLIQGSGCQVVNCSFENNNASHGSAIQIEGSDCQVVDCSFENNYVPDYGGALYIQGSGCQAVNCSFENNKAYLYGALWIQGSGCQAVNCSFENNIAAGYGAALSVLGSGCQAVNCSFENNDAYFGGAVYWSEDNGILADSTFDNNSASDGGAIYWVGNSGNIKNSIFVSNYLHFDDKGNYGGAVCLSGENGIISGCTFWNNSADFGGALAVMNNTEYIGNCSFINNSASRHAGAVYLNYNITEFTDCLFENNTASSYGGAVVVFKSAKMSNLTFKANSAENVGALLCVGNNALLSDSFFEDNFAGKGGGDALHWEGLNGTVFNSTFVNTLKTIQIWWKDDIGGKIDQCIFLNTTSNNIRKGNAEVIKRNYTIAHNGSSIMYGNPEIISITILNAVPVSSQVTVRIFNEKISNSYTITPKNNVIYLYDELKDLNIGTYNISALFGEDDTFYSSNYAFAISVNKVYSSLDVEADNVTKGYESTIKATVLDLNGQPVGEGAVTFFDGDNPIGRVNVSQGTAILKYAPEDSGNHIIYANYSSGNYESSNGTCKLLVDDINIQISDESGTVGYNSTFTASVSALYSAVIDGKVTFYVLGKSVGTAYIENGVASINYMPLTTEIHNVTAVYLSKDSVIKREAVAAYEVFKAVSAVDLAFVNGSVGVGMLLNASVTSPNGHKINEGKVTFEIDGVSLSSVNVADGIASVLYVPDKSGEHAIQAIFESDNYIASNDTGRIFFDEVTVKLSAESGTVGFNSTFTATVSALYSAVIDGKVTFYVDGKSVGTADVENGVASIKYAPTASGTHKLKAVYSGNNFSDTGNSTDYVVDKADSHLDLTVGDGKVGETIELTAYVTSSNGLKINDGAVSFYEDGNLIKSGNVVNGVASINYVPATAGNHVISARFTGSDYQNSNESSSKSIDRANTSIVFYNDGTIYYNTPATFTFEVKSGSNPVKEGTLRVYINGKSVASGNTGLSVSYTPADSNALTVSAVYDGTENYIASNITSSVNVKKLPTSVYSSEVTAVYNDVCYLTVTLKDKNGNAVSGASVDVNLKVARVFITDSNGQIVVPVSGLAPATYSASITFAGSAVYEPSSGAVNVVVKKATPKIVAKKKTFKRKVKVKKYSITLKTNKNKALAKVKVKIKVGKKKYSAKTNSKGKATFKIKKLTKKGKYKSTITFAGNSCYNKVTKKVKITVK